MTMNRRLIRPNLAEIREKENREAAKKKIQPPYDTHAENYYYLKQMNKKTRMAVVFNDGQVVEGFVEWYDRNCFKLNREDAVVIDVRETHEWDRGHIPNARHIALGQLSKRMHEIEKFKSRPVIVVALNSEFKIASSVASTAASNSRLIRAESSTTCSSW